MGVPEGDLLGVGPCAGPGREVVLKKLLLLIVSQERFRLLFGLGSLCQLLAALLLFLGLECGLVVDEAVDLAMCARRLLFALVEALPCRVEAHASRVSPRKLPWNVNVPSVRAIVFACGLVSHFGLEFSSTSILFARGLLPAFGRFPHLQIELIVRIHFCVLGVLGAQVLLVQAFPRAQLPL